MFNFRKIDRHANLMNRMGAVRDVDFGERIASGAMSAETYRAAILSCTHCEHPDDCASYLDTSAQGAPVPPYCRNAGLLARLGQA